MKAKSKVLLGLLVALAMMVMAVPAFAATFTVKPTVDATVYVGTQPEISVEITSTDSTVVNQPYTITFTDNNSDSSKRITFPQKTLTTESGTVKSAPANALANTLADTEHTVTVTVKDKSGNTLNVDTAKFTVKAPITAKLDGATAPAAAGGDYTKAVAKGSVSGLTVYPSVEEKTTYKWQYADAKTGAATVADTAKNWKDITGEESPALGLVDDLNGKYVRCLVTNGNLTVVAATVDTPASTPDDAEYCVKLSVNDASAITLDEKNIKDATYFANTANPTDLSISANGASNSYTYKWFKDGAEITDEVATEIGVAGHKTATLDLGASITEKEAGKYKVEVTDQTNTSIKATSKEANITVNKTPVVKVANVIESDAKANYDNTQTAKTGKGTIVVPAADADKALTINATIENPGKKYVCVWTKGGNVGTGEALNIDAGDVHNGDTYVLTVTTDGLTSPLVYNVTIVVSEGQLTGGVFTQTDGKVTESPIYYVTLPEGKEWSDGMKGVAANATIASYIKASNIPDDLTPKKQAIDAETGVLSFYLDGTVTTAADIPTVENMSLTLDGTAVKNGATGTNDIVLPVKDGVGYNITAKAAAGDVEITAPVKSSVKGKADYTGSPIAATVEAKSEGLGTIKNIRYEAFNATATPSQKPSTPSSKATTTAPTDAGTYAVFCDIEGSEKYGEAKDVVLDQNLVIDQITLTPDNADKYLEMDPVSAVYDGKAKGTTVTFKDGITKAGVVDKYTYREKGKTANVIPTNVGEYDVYVTTKAATPAVEGEFNNIARYNTDPGVKVGVFKITKTLPTEDLYTMEPTEVPYSGAGQEPVITPAEGAGKVAKTIFYKDGDTKALEGLPTEAGEYKVVIETEESNTYAATSEKDGTALELGTFTIKEDKPDQPAIWMIGHVQDVDWGDKGSGKAVKLEAGKTAQVGTTGLGKRVEAITILVPEGYKVEGFAHIQDRDDVEVVEDKNPTYIKNMEEIGSGYKAYKFGTTGQAKRIEAINIAIKTEDGKYVEGLEYATHVQNMGWLGTVRNGSFSGSRGLALRMEAVRFYYDDQIRRPTEIDKEDTKTELR